MKKFIRSIFRLQPFENLLVFLIGKFPNRFFRGLASQNYVYPPDSIRRCKRHGINYTLDINDYQNWLIYFYSDADSSFGLLEYIKKDSVIFDVGGNIGQTAMMMAQKTGSCGKVFSFEPYPETYQKFQVNLQSNPSLTGIVHIAHIALGAAPAELKMYQDCDTNSGANRMVPQGNAITATITVPVTTMDLFVAEKKLKPDFIKIDVEGFEMEVLKGAGKTLSDHKPSLFIELDDKNLKKQGSSAFELCDYLAGFGYKLFEEGSETPFDLSRTTKMVNIYCTVN